VNLHAMLLQRGADGNPVRVGVIGAGKFGSMYLSQARRTPGIHVLGIADLVPQRARDALARVDWPAEQYAAASFDNARRGGTTFITDDAEALIREADVVIDSTGSPAAGIRHALLACEHGTHIVMVNVEADVLAGPLLAERAKAAGIVYTMAYGDQPALICEMVDWARACGLPVVCAGKGTKYLPEFHASTPDTVWNYYGLTAEQAAAGGMNPQMFDSFLDGTKSGIEMAAVANATGLTPPRNGLSFPPCGVQDLPHILRPRADGGQLDDKGTVEVISSEERDGRRVVGDLRWGVYVTFEAPSDYVARCFSEYGLLTDSTGRYSTMYKPFHLIGLELGISVASAALRGEPTGVGREWRGDVVATAKRDLAAGEVLDGEGGFTVWGKLMRTADSLALGGLPIGLAHGMALKRPIAAGEPVRWQDVDYDDTDATVAIRREMETRSRRNAGAAPVESGTPR
jgi:predicted homoserine dehydrogenase-like protein